MKKGIYFFLALSFMLLAAIGTTKAQSNWEAGLRFGDRWSADITIPMGHARFHPNVYFNRFGIGAYFDWMFAISDGPSGLKFYPGVGPEIWFGSGYSSGNDVDVAIAGDFGAEYSFKFPLTIGFDWRPGFTLTNDFKWKSSNWGFIARFRFGSGSKFVKTN
jgi:hypothetical protein